MKPQFDYYFLDEMTPESFSTIVDKTPVYNRFVDQDETRIHLAIPKELYMNNRIEAPGNGGQLYRSTDSHESPAGERCPVASSAPQAGRE